MHLTANRGKKNRATQSKCVRLVLWVLCTFLCITGYAVATQQETRVVVALKGVSTSDGQAWRTLSIGGLFDVQTPDGTHLGRLRANPTDEQLAAGESNTLVITDTAIEQVTVIPVEGSIQGGFQCRGPVSVRLTPNEQNGVTVMAYAQQGLFRVKNSIAGSGMPAKGAEFVVMDMDGNLCQSFVTDEEGTYRANQALPNGQYRLVQLRSAAGTIPNQQMKDFVIDTYYGSEADLVLVTVDNQPIPNQSEKATLVLEKTSTFVKQGSENSGIYTSDVDIELLFEGTSSLPMRDCALTLRPTAAIRQGVMVASEGTSVLVDSVTVNIGAAGVDAVVQSLSAFGLPNGQVQRLISGQQMQLEKASGIRISYINRETGDVIIPAGFRAGDIKVSFVYQPTQEEPSISGIIFTAEAGYSYQYPDTDGNSMVTAAAQLATQEISISIPDGRRTIAITARAEEEKTLLLSASPESEELDEDVQLALLFPQGSRVAKDELEKSIRLLRLQDRDVVVFSWSKLMQGMHIPLEAGAFTQADIYVQDPQTMPKTQDNPYGALLRAELYESNTMLDAVTDRTEGLYAVIPIQVRGDLSLPSASPFGKAILNGVMYEDVNHSGTRTEDEPVAAGRGVVVRGEQTGIYYGAITDVNGNFVLYAEDSPADSTATLMAMLPETAMIIGSRETGKLERKGMTIPDVDYPISYIRQGRVGGVVTLNNGRVVQGAQVSLTQDGQLIEQEDTDIKGTYHFDALSMGDYHLTVTLPTDESAVFTEKNGMQPSEDGKQATYKLTLAYGQEETISFAAYHLSSLQGQVTVGGRSQASLPVNLIPLNGDVLFTTTDVDGRYHFDDVLPGDYTLQMAMPPHTVVPANNLEATAENGSYEVPLYLVAGSDMQTNIALEETGGIEGQIAELGPGIVISLASLDGQQSLTTDVEGRFIKQGLIAGDYTVYAPLPEGKTLASDATWQVTQRGDMIWVSISILPGETYQLPAVQYVELTSIQGVAYLDENGDQVYSQGEPLMSGVAVALQQKKDDRWLDVANVKTNEYGVYSFRDLQPGVYRVASMAGGEGAYVASVGPRPATMGDSGVMISQELSLRSGEILSGETDVAIGQPSELSFEAFADSNENGIRGEYERPVAGVTVEVIQAGQDLVLASGVTDAKGMLQLTDVPPGSYLLRVSLPDGYMFTRKGEGTGSGVSCVEGDESVAYSDPVVFLPGRVVEAGAGMIPVGSFSGMVFKDVNNNAVMDEGEPGVAGVQLTIRGVKTGIERTLVTDETGLYRFTSLRNDNYDFSASLPEGMLFARYSLEGGDRRSVFTVEGTTGKRQFPVKGAADVTDKNVGVIDEGVVRGIAFLDLNYNGIRDEGEPGCAGVTLELIKESNSKSMGKKVTGEDGSYDFDSLRGGEYRLRAILPDDGSIFTQASKQQGLVNLFEQRESRRENSISPISIENGDVVETVVGLARGAQIKGTVFQDADYNGVLDDKDKRISGVKVEVRNAQEEIIASTTTNANGNYLLDGIMPGMYSLHFLRKEGYAFTRFRPQEEAGNWVRSLQGSHGVTELIDIKMGATLEGVNAGMLLSSTLVGILFDDLNDNGLMDDGEGGMQDVRVRLVSEDAEIDLWSDVTAEGTYFFDGVMPGQYTLMYTLPEHVELAKVITDGNTLQGNGGEVETTPFQVEMGIQVSRPLVGVVRLGSFEGFLFHDKNANGVQDDGEERLSGMEITLTADNAQLQPVTFTADEEGAFIITDLRPANYQLSMSLPAGYIFSSDILDSSFVLDTANAQVLACPWEELVARRNNAVGAVKPASIRGYLWLDENKSGTQEADEQLMVGVEFELIDEAKASVVKRVSPGEDGYVAFANVRPGTYTVRFTIPTQAEPAGELEATMLQQSGRMFQKGIVVGEGETFADMHAGLVSRTSIGGTVQLDEDGKRIQLEGIVVRLYQRDVVDPIQTTTTQANGSYQFSGLWPNEYRIECALPANMLFVRQGDPNYEQGASVIIMHGDAVGESDFISLKMANHRMDEDVIFIRPGKVGDQAWLDSNQNGLMDADEPLIPGVIIRLKMDGQVVSETKTDAYGYYLFEDVYPGTYTLEAVGYPELGITNPVAELRLISSCLVSGDGSSAGSEPFSVVSGSVNLNFDLGYILQAGQSMPEAIVPPPNKDWTGAYVSGGKAQ